MALEGMLGIDHQKLAILQCYLLRCSYGSALIRKHPILWKKRIRREGYDEGEKIGLGFKNVIEKYGFGWLPKEMFKRATMIGILQEMDQAIERIKTSGKGKKDERRRLSLLKWLATRIMRQYHQDVWDALYKSPFKFKGKESELEQQRMREAAEGTDSEDQEERPRKRVRIMKKNAKVVKKKWEEPPGLTYGQVRAELEEEPLPVGMGKLYLNKKDFFRLIFQPEEDGVKGQG